MGVPKSILIHVSRPIGDEPRHALVYKAELSRPGRPLNAYSAACMFSIVHKKCEHAMPDELAADGLLASMSAILNSLAASHVGLARKRIA